MRVDTHIGTCTVFIKVTFSFISGSSLSGIAVKRFLARSPVRTKAAPKCSATIPLCGNTYTPTGLASTSVPNAAKLSWRALNSNATNWFIPAKNRSSALSRAAASGFLSTSIYARTSGSIPVTGLMYVLSTDATRNLHSPQTSSPTSSHTPSKSKTYFFFKVWARSLVALNSSSSREYERSSASFSSFFFVPVNGTRFVVE